VSLIEELDPASLIDQWRRAYDIDISEELAGVSEIRRFRCDETGLEFYDPPEAAGSGALYEALQELNWYYMPHKWEYDAAAEDIQLGDRVLEVGCGVGDFVAWIQNERETEVLGIDLNEQAVEEAQRQGRPVTTQRLEALDESERYDVVCAFQVLEHIRDVVPFIEACLARLRPGGRLIFGVPNCNSFIRHVDEDLLNQPPHHMSRWTASVFRTLPQIAPVRVRRIAFEPLADYHLQWYTNVQFGRLPSMNGFTRRAKKVIQKTVLPVARRTKLHRLIRGHTLYTCFEKTSSP
jgi:SAM-dependent methyltransferase